MHLEFWGGDVVPWKECLCSSLKALGYPQHHKQVWWGMCACGPSTQKVEVAEVQGHPWLHSEFEASLGNRRPCLTKNPFSLNLFPFPMFYPCQFKGTGKCGSL